MIITLHRRAAWFAEALAGLAVFGLLILAAVTTGDILMRYLFATPIRGLTDLTMVAAAALLAACMPHVVASRGNISVDFVGRSLGTHALKALNFFGAVVTALFFAVMAWQCALYALDMYQAGEAMPTLRWPVWPWWTAVAVFTLLTALVALATLTDPSTS